VRLVVDASVVIPCFVPERFSAAARSWLDAADLLLAPELLALECANALWKKLRRGEITPGDAGDALEQVLGGLIELRPAAILARAAFRLASDLAHPVYDCTYVALADAENAELLTADRELVRLTVAGGRNVIAHWVGDPIPRLH
jgi:predicted nucleic acid-binding protein